MGFGSSGLGTRTEELVFGSDSISILEETGESCSCSKPLRKNKKTFTESAVGEQFIAESQFQSFHVYLLLLTY